MDAHYQAYIIWLFDNTPACIDIRASIRMDAWRQLVDAAIINRV